MPYQTFLVEPIFGEDHPRDDAWEPHKLIVGWYRKDTDEHQNHLWQFGIGAMWRAIWMPKNWDWDNESEPHLIVRCPNGPDDAASDWDVDSRASNCTLPNDKTHRCWVRHGTPPNITVDKAGETCQAGAGSIQMPKWHGFLRNGVLDV